MFTIRSAEVSDASAIARVQIETWRTAYRELIPMSYLAELSIERRTATHRVYLERRTSAVEIFVAEGESGIIGYCSCGRSQERENVGELYAIYVLESFAGQGVGTSLIRRAEDWFRERQFDRAELWVLEGNHSARGFYRRMGWGDSGQVKDEDIGGVIVREVKFEKSFNLY